MGRYDILWKGMMEEVFEDMMRFVFPEADRELDFNRGFEFLDKELGEMYPEPEKPAQTREVDKLVKVYQKDGEERWMLVHLEVQGWNDPLFSKRMFQYYYRILDRFDRPVTAIAIFTARAGRNMPGRFEDRCLGTRLTYEYNTLSTLDYSHAQLEASDNPFAIVLLVVKMAELKNIRSNDEFDALLLEQKTLIAKLLHKKKRFSQDKIDAIDIFLNNYITFRKPETNLIFMDRLDNITGKRKTMGIAEQLAEIKAKEALEVGLQKGLEQGRAEGKEKASTVFVQYLLANTEFSIEKIASLANVSVDFVEKVQERQKSK
jgi:predicted transposase YdaD